jgi:hypothetical protein
VWVGLRGTKGNLPFQIIPSSVTVVIKVAIGGHLLGRRW